MSKRLNYHDRRICSRTQPIRHVSRCWEAFNQAASAGVFDDYLGRKADNTLRRQKADLDLFAQFLAAVGIATVDPAKNGGAGQRYQTSAAAWKGITWGLVKGFINWQLQEGYAVSSVNIRLSTVKTYAKLAFKAGALDNTEYALIKAVEGYRLKEGKRLDEKRTTSRRGVKKAESVSITDGQATALKQAQPTTPQGRRDAVLMSLLLDHGLRCGEVAILKISDFDLKAGQLVFYRPKVDKTQTHNLSRDTLKALKAWFDSGDAPLAKDAPLLRGSNKSGALTTAGISERAITKRVRVLGEAIEVHGLSAHDCRHYWATKHAKHGVDPFRLQEAGGWSSLAMPRRYVEAAKIANEGMGD